MKRFLQSNWAFGLACLLSGLPVLLSTYPPMVDVPQHAAQIAALKSMLLGGDWPYADLFAIQALTPYWLGYGLVLLLGIPFGVLLAMQIVVALSQALFVWTAARFSVRAGMPMEWRWLFLMLPFGFAYQWGFLNFMVAAPLGFVFAERYLETEEQTSGTALLKTSCWLHVLFFAHILIAAFFCMIAMLLMARSWQGWRHWLRRCLPVFTILPATFAWIALGVSKSPEVGDPIIWNAGASRVPELLSAMVSAPDQGSGALLGLLVMALPFLLGYRFRKAFPAFLPFLLFVAWMCLVPHYMAGTMFTYQRFGIFGLPLYLIYFEKGETRPRHADLVRGGTVLLVAGMVAWHGLRSSIFNAEMLGYRQVMAQAQPGKRMLMLAIDPSSRASAAPLMLHVAGWYQAEMGGLAEFSFARFWVSPIRFKSTTGSYIYPGFEWNPSQFEWSAHHGDLYDYILVRAPLSAEAWLASRSGGKARLISRYSGWQLYAVSK